MMAVEERGFVKATRRGAGRGSTGNGWIAPAMARHPSTARTVIVVCVVVVVALLLAVLGWVGYSKWASRKQKRKTPLAATGEAEETRDTDYDNPRPVIAISKSRKQAAATSWEP